MRADSSRLNVSSRCIGNTSPPTNTVVVHLFVQPPGHILGFWVWAEVLFTGRSRSQTHYSLRHKPDRLGYCTHANVFCRPRHTVSFIVVTSTITVHIPSRWFPESSVRHRNNISCSRFVQTDCTSIFTRITKCFLKAKDKWALLFKFLHLLHYLCCTLRMWICPNLHLSCNTFSAYVKP